MEFRVLGSLEVRRGGDLVEIGSSNERKILAALWKPMPSSRPPA